MAEPQTMVVPGDGSSVLSYPLPANVLQYVESVVAVIDNSAGGDAVPVLSIATGGGTPIADKEQGRSIPAGDSGRATWAHRLTDEGEGGGADEGDVLFNDPNTETDPRYLDIPVNQAGPSGFMFNLEGITLRLHQLLGALGTGFILLDVDSSNTRITLSQGTAEVRGYQHLSLVSDTGNFTLLAGGGDGIIRAFAAGTAIRIRTHANTDVIAAVDEKLGFFNKTPVVRQVVSGSRGGNAALASLLTGLANLGLITDSTTP